jgi:glutamate racemase
VSSAEETAKDVYRVLLGADLLRPDDAPPPRHVFRATGPAEPFARLSRRFLGPDVLDVAAVAAHPVGGVA